MSRPWTRERIDASFRRWMVFIWIWRAFCIAYLVFAVAALVMTGKPIFWVYIVFPFVWWALSVLWKRNARDIRDTRLHTLRLYEDMGRMWGDR